LRLAVNASGVISDPNIGPATVAQIINPGGILYGLDDGGLAAGHDIAGAKQLLAEAGWLCNASTCVKAVTDKKGAVITQTLAFTLVTNERVPRNALSQVIQQQLAAAGFAVDIRIVHGLGKDSKLFAPYERGGILLTRDFDAALYQAPSLTSLSGVFDCASIPSETAPAPTQGNVFGYCDKNTDGLIAAAEAGESTVSEAGRVKALSDALKVIVDNALFVPLYSPLWILPSRDVSGLRYADFGIVTWNAWEWQQWAKP
jgi:ABC-type transport system substrate-binding protein